MSPLLTSHLMLLTPPVSPGLASLTRITSLCLSQVSRPPVPGPAPVTLNTRLWPEASTLTTFCSQNTSMLDHSRPGHKDMILDDDEVSPLYTHL